MTFERQKELDREVRYEMKRKWKQLSPEQLNDIVPDPDNKYDFTSGKIFGIFLMFQHWKIYNQRKVAIAEAKKKVEEQRAVAEKLERLEILEEEITIIRRDSRLSSLPPTGLEGDSDFLVRRNGELKNSILSMMAPVGIATNSIKSRPIPKPRSSSINSTSSQRGLLLSNIKSTNLSEVQGHVNAGYDIASDNVSDEVFIGDEKPVEQMVPDRRTGGGVPSVVPSVVPSAVPSVVSGVVSTAQNSNLTPISDNTPKPEVINQGQIDKQPHEPVTLNRRPSKVTSNLLDNLNNLSKASDVSEIKMAETFTNSVIKSAIIYAPNENENEAVASVNQSPAMTLTLTAVGNELLNENWPNHTQSTTTVVDRPNSFNKNEENDGQNAKITYDDEDLPL